MTTWFQWWLCTSIFYLSYPKRRQIISQDFEKEDYTVVQIRKGTGEMIYLRATEYRYAKTPRICAVVARTIFMSRQMYYADSICLQANLQPFINRSIEVKKAIQDFLLILAVSELDIFNVGFNKISMWNLSSSDRWDNCRVIKGHLIKIFIPGLIKF